MAHVLTPPRQEETTIADDLQVTNAVDAPPPAALQFPETFGDDTTYSHFLNELRLDLWLFAAAFLAFGILAAVILDVSAGLVGLFVLAVATAVLAYFSRR